MFEIDGIKVSFRHERYDTPRHIWVATETEHKIIGPITAKTYCIVRSKYTGRVLSQEIAYCHVLDQFCYETGRRIALTKALAKYVRPARTKIWRAYWKAKLAAKIRGKFAAINAYERKLERQAAILSHAT